MAAEDQLMLTHTAPNLQIIHLAMHAADIDAQGTGTARADRVAVPAKSALRIVGPGGGFAADVLKATKVVAARTVSPLKLKLAFIIPSLND